MSGAASWATASSDARTFDGSRMIKFVLPAIAAMLSPTCASAQSEAGGVAPINAPHAEGALASMQLEMRQRAVKDDVCWKLGCLIIVNETRGYDVVGFYLANNKPGAPLRWSRNAFVLGLQPQKAALRPKTGGKGACAVPVRFVLRHQRTHEEVTMEGNASLCSSPRMDSMLRLKVLEPKVIWDDPAQKP